MAYNYIGTNSVGAGIRISPTSDDDYLIDQNVTIGSTDNNAIFGVGVTNLSFNILGTVFSPFDTLNFFQNTGTSLFFDITIGETGSLIAEGDAIDIQGNASTNEGYTRVTNNGWIKAGDDGFYVAYQAEFHLRNTGVIETTGISTGSWAVFAQTNIATIANSGTIAGSDLATAIYTYSAELGGVTTISNTGEIISGLSGYAIVSSRHNDTVTNDGYIHGRVSLGLGESASNAFGDTLKNKGTVIGDVSTGYGDDLIENSGSLSGQVDLGDGDDQFLGETGTVDGEVRGQGGDDILKTGLGDDLINGGEGRDKMYGGAGNDTATYENSTASVRVNLTTHRGRGGEARGDWLFDIENLIGSHLDDVLIGDVLTNILEGMDGADTLNGEGGADFLFGGNGDDTLIGGDGDDILNGGLDRDILWGGDGVDIFEFLDVAESGIGSNRDVIKDFEQGVDLIDLAAMGATSFSAGGFTNTAGEVTFKLIGGGTKTVVEYDHDGDGAADFQILMTNGGFTMTSDDFVLG